MTIIAWNAPPRAQELQRHPQARHLIVCLPQRRLPDWTDCPKLQAALACVQFHDVNVLEHIFDHQTIWLIPQSAARRLHNYFGGGEIIWQTESVPQDNVLIEKPWFRQPENHIPRQNTGADYDALIVGAGLAGAATAYELARRGWRMAVLDSAAQPAQAASGNRQGLLYAKISPHDTAQTELLLCGYGYTHRILNHLLNQSDGWKETGVLHINFNDGEARRNTALAAQTWHQHLYRGVSSSQASELAGILIEQQGLFWQHGAWVHPPALVQAYLSHQYIDFYENNQIEAAAFNGKYWQLQTNRGDEFSGSHVVFCTGANYKNTPIIQSFPLQSIRGQTALAAAQSANLKTALSGHSYIAPAWNGIHCFGATFFPNDESDEWREIDDVINRHELEKLNHYIYQQLKFLGSLKGHAAVRCDAHDHLPVVGALGDAAAMRQVYAKLALDKHYRVNAACPYVPNAWANTAHGSRGLATVPLCAAYLAAQMNGEPLPLSRRLQQALSPNRLIIRKIIRGL